MIVEDQVLHIEVDAARLTATGLTKLIGAIARGLNSHFTSAKTGEQSIARLNRQQRPLESSEINAEELSNIKRRLKSYAVDFAVTKDKASGSYHLWFKAQDLERVQFALQNAIINKAPPAQEHGKVQDICDRAKEAAATLNATRTAVPPERGERI